MTKRRDHEASSIVGFAIDTAKDTVSYLADLFARIVRSIKQIAPLAVATACQSNTPDPAVVPESIPHEVRVEKPTPKEKEEAPKPIGDFSITFYYVVTEDEVVAKKKPVVVAANDNVRIDESDPELASIAPPVSPDQVKLYDSSCQPISEVSREFASQIALQGTGKLKDGRVLNIWGACRCEDQAGARRNSPCFKVTAAQWGTGGTGRQLQPFRTVAVDPKIVKLGSLLYVPLLEGRQMPGRSPWGGFVHDGCVVADDVGGGIKGSQLDLFVGRRGWFLGMSGKEGSHAWAKSVPVYDGTKLCERKGRHVSRKSGAI
jgi:3D (Asp-Asp-Asp) domain-containing protein